MIDLNKIVNESLLKIEEEKFVEEIVETRLKKTLEDIVDDTFRSYSDFGKNLKEHINKNLNVNLNKLGLEGYNGLVLAAVQEQLDKAITIQGIEKIKESTEEMLSDVKEEYCLNELIEKIKEKVDQGEVDFDDEMTLIIENRSSGYKHIYLDEEEVRNKFECDYQISIDEEGKPYSIKLKGDEIDTKKILGGLWGLDALLFKIYASGSRIVLDQGDDVDAYDLSLSDCDY